MSVHALLGTLCFLSLGDQRGWALKLTPVILNNWC